MTLCPNERPNDMMLNVEIGVEYQMIFVGFFNDAVKCIEYLKKVG